MEQYASPLRQQKKRDGPQWLVQALVCAGALVAAGALTIEARISTAAVHPPGTPQSASALAPKAAEAPLTETEKTAEVSARAAAQRALAEALAHANAARAASPPISNENAGAPVSDPKVLSKTSAATEAHPAAVASQAAQGPSSAGPTQPAPRPIPDPELKLLAMKAAQALKAGDIGGARMVLERAAGAGDATALFALGETYDPDVLAKMRVRGLRGDREKAIDLYRRASQAGVTEAQKKLEALPEGLTASAK